MIAVGLMCGTSLDGIDAARVTLAPRDGGYAVETQAFAMVPFEAGLRARVLNAYPPARISALAFSRLHADVGEAFGRAALAVGAREADFIASHGLTLAHDGKAHHTLQIGDPFRIREATGRTVVYDFRSADTAAGGQGAPLVPFVDRLLLGAPDEVRVALNLGGIANLTVLAPGGAADDLIAFDSGPANLPIDTYVFMRSDGRARYDRAGAYAAAGAVDDTLLDELLADPFFRAAPPKSTGRERFGTEFITRIRSRLDALAFADAVATLTALTVRSVAEAVQRHAPDAARVIVSGGGAHNLTMLDGLRAALPGAAVERSDRFGIDPDAKEAIAFAILGCEALRDRPAGLPRVTGARGARVLGAIAPVGLAALLERVRSEEQPDE
jgi:anhydro-N-acetylmuramic acid kinase